MSISIPPPYISLNMLSFVPLNSGNTYPIDPIKDIGFLNLYFKLFLNKLFPKNNGKF